MTRKKGKNKKNRISGSDSQHKVSIHSKKHKQNSIENNTSVSDILNQTNNILFGCNDELDNSVFQDTYNIKPN